MVVSTPFNFSSAFVCFRVAFCNTVPAELAEFSAACSFAFAAFKSSFAFFTFSAAASDNFFAA
jgi:hypothetical protein